jgi:predicted ATPase/DNA-binding CsgD family transcriptional regulator
VKTAPAKARTPKLPAEPTSFVGRRLELQEIKRLLTTTRLLTLTGSGGVGKTRLALGAAAEVARGFPDGVWFAPLAPIHDPLLVPQAIFVALDALDRSSDWSLVTLTNFLADKRLLLVIDNCEHLVDACAILASTLLKACPQVRLLTTSREALNVVGEVRMPVPPMSLPHHGGEARAEDLANSEAVRLLSERAAAVLPDFAVNDENAESILELCRRLDGIPLALELAAVRLGALSLDQLNTGLASSLSVLGSGNRGAEARQRTLEATIGWSHDLLEQAEQVLWARLSVFAGGFDAPAAIEVCNDDRVPQERIVELLGALVEKSIVRRELKSGNAPRYWLLETVRQFGRQNLRRLGEETRIHARHLEWVVGLARTVGAFDDRQAELFRRMDVERDNLWAALEFCTRDPDSATFGAELAQHLVAYWTCRGQFGDLRRMLTSLAQLTAEDSAARAHYLRAAAVLANSQNDVDARDSLARESLRVATASHDSQAIAASLAWLAIPLAVTGNVTEGIEAAESALSLARTLASRPTQLVATAVLCNILQMTGPPERAIELGEEGVRTSVESGELWARGYILVATAQVHWRKGDSGLAEAQARSAAAFKHALDDRSGLQLVLETLAWMAAEGGAYERAATLLGAAEHLRTASGLSFQEAQRQQHERSMALVRAALAQRPDDVLYQRGLTMTIDEAVAFAVEDRLPSRAPAAVTTETGIRLTKRELEIARLIAGEMISRDIATKLFISERTVEAHVTNMLNKLGLNSRIELARWLTTVRGTEPVTPAASRFQPSPR